MAESSTSNVKDVSDDNSMTLVDFLEEEMQLESDADAVLGPSDDKNCTYNKGYLQRQALYACMTCTSADCTSKPAGICLACSYHCHEDHVLVELYTKRFFKCDCGNGRFNGKKCNLEPNKTEENEKNCYNQNFSGLYCICSRPYPDPEDDISDEMLQCTICEDWYHTRHLNAEVPQGANYSELICGTCTDKLPFLKHYMGFSVFPTSKHEDSKENVTVDGENTEAALDYEKVSLDLNGKEIKQEDKTNNVNERSIKNEENLYRDGTVKEIRKNEALTIESNDISCNDMKLPSSSNEGACKLITNEIHTGRVDGSATFWPSSFRSLLCACLKCQELYATHNVQWLIDEKDTVQSYESISKETRKNSQYEAGMEALSKLDRVSQVEAIHNYNDLKSNLSDFLGKFVKQKRVVKKEDIEEFFTDMQAKKQRKNDNGTPPYSCH